MPENYQSCQTVKFDSNIKLSKSNNLGLATVGLVTIKKEIITSHNFLAGKGGDPVAADEIIKKVWSDKKTEQLSEYLEDNSLFLTMPSTTGKNVIPLVLAEFLYKKTGIPFALGDEYFDVNHTKPSKSIPRDKRLFEERDFSVNKGKKVEQLNNFNIIIIDDIITTGGSIRAYAELLRNENLKVSHIVGLMGDRRFEIDKKTETKLKTSLEEKKININFESINYITRTEAGSLLRLLNNARTENAIKKITGQLQRIQRCGTVENIKRYSKCEVRGNFQGKDNSNETTGERISAYSSTSSSKQVEWEIKIFRGENLIKKENVFISGDLGGKNEQKKIKNTIRRIVSTYNFGLVRVKFRKTGKTAELNLPQKNKIHER